MGDMAPVGRTMREWNNGRYSLGEIRRLTWENYGYHIGMFSACVGPHTPVISVTEQMVKEWIVDQRRTGIADSTINTRMSTVRAFFRWAVDEDLVDRSPVRRIKPIKLPRRQVRAVPDADITDVIAAAPFRERTMIIVAVQTGLRRAELANLRVSDWHPIRAALWVDEGKGGHGRWVSVPVEAAIALEQWVVTLPEGCEWMWPSNYGPRRGLPVVPDTVGDAIARVSAEAGHRFTPHPLRHTMVKGMLRNGATLPEVAQQVGHSSVAVTGDIYGWASDDEIAEAVEGRRYRR